MLAVATAPNDGFAKFGGWVTTFVRVTMLLLILAYFLPSRHY